MPTFQGREMTPDEYVSARLGIDFPPFWKDKMVAMEYLLGRWQGSLVAAIMGVYDDEYDAHVTALFDDWARGEIDIIDCAQQQINYELRRGLFDEHGRPNDDVVKGE
jgi:hypothetical protein